MPKRALEPAQVNNVKVGGNATFNNNFAAPAAAAESSSGRMGFFRCSPS